MKALYFLLFILCSCTPFSEDSSLIGEHRISPENPTKNDSIIYLCELHEFGGNCTYIQHLDSIVGHTIHISGEYNIRANCVNPSSVLELQIGRLSAGDYKIRHSVTEANGALRHKAFDYTFSVSE